MLKWKKEYLEHLKLMTNEEVLDEYTELASGDDYDGCRTQRGEWEYLQITKELHERLIKCGFLESLPDK